MDSIMTNEYFILCIKSELLLFLFKLIYSGTK